MIYTWKDICPVEIEAMLFMFEHPKSTLIHFPNTRIESQGTLVDLEALHSLWGIKPLCTNSTSVVSIYWVPCVLSGQINTTLEHNDCHHEVCVKMCVADRWGVCRQPLIRPPAPLPTPLPFALLAPHSPCFQTGLELWCSGAVSSSQVTGLTRRSSRARSCQTRGMRVRCVTGWMREKVCVWSGVVSKRG